MRRLFINVFLAMESEQVSCGESPIAVLYISIALSNKFCDAETVACTNLQVTDKFDTGTYVPCKVAFFLDVLRVANQECN